MMNQDQRATSRMKAEHVYALLLHLCPPAHRRAFGPLILQTFTDHCRAVCDAHGRVGRGFWLEMLADVTASASREQWSTLSALQGGVPVRRIRRQPRVLPGLLLGGLALVMIVWTYALFPGRVLTRTSAGVIAALLGAGIALGTFFLVDNLFLGVVSQQVDKLQGFYHSALPTMRAEDDRELLSVVLCALPLLGGA